MNMKSIRLILVAILFVPLVACSLFNKSPNAVQTSPNVVLPSNASAAPVPMTKTIANNTYSSPLTNGVKLRNPSINLPSNFSPSSGVTISKISTDQPYLAMTFDDGPHPKHTPRLLDMLKDRNIKATFYVIGRSVDTHPQIARRIVAEGHEIGNHTYTHRKLTVLSDAQVKQEMDKTRASIGRATGVKARTMRPPYGALLQRQREMLHREYGFPTILWSVDPLDWQKPGISVVRQRIVDGARPGGVILAHDLHGSTVDAMPSTLDALLAKGFKFVTISQLIALKGTTGSY